MPTKQFNVSLGDALRSQLEAAGAQSGKTIAEEIRSRLTRTFEQDAIDKPTKGLLAAVDDLARTLQEWLGQAWYEHAGVNAAFAAALGARVKRSRPPGDLVLPPPDAGRARPIATDDPEAFGLSLEVLTFQMESVDPSTLGQLLEKLLKDTAKRKGDKS